uniref:Transcription factor AP-2 C-terminal domain-containing protein n=1 Tax=Knipowitschia caucasica TaxID=637954 RepID=A0AAV2LEL4_KNICA
MDPPQRAVGLDPPGNLVFTVVKPMVGLLQVSAAETGPSGSMGLQTQDQGLVSHMSNPGLVSHMVQSNPGLVTHIVQSNPGLVTNMAVQMNTERAEVQDPGPEPVLNQNQDLEPDPAENQNQDFGADPGQSGVGHLPFAEVASLLDPNMKGSKARKFLISYEEIRRRLLPPEKMSLRSIAAYTRVSRGPARKKTLQDTLRTLGLSPGTTTAVSSSFSKLTEGDTRSLCEDMRDFSQEYIDYEAVAKRLIPKVNTVQHWSKIIETRNHLEDLRQCLLDPSLSQSFDSVTHGLGLGMVHVVLDLVSSVIQAQVRILSGPENPELTADTNANATMTQRKRKLCRRHGNGSQGAAAILKSQRRKKRRQNGQQGEELQAAVPPQQTEGSNVLLLTVGYEAVSSELNTSGD